MQNCRSGKKAYTYEVASTYEEDRRSERIWHVEQAYMEKVVRLLPDGSSILDVPVGTGRFLDLYQEHGSQVVGVDISESMLDEARNKIYSPLIRVELGDVENLSYPDNSFDYVICWRLLHLVSNDSLRKVVSELTRVSSHKLYIQAYVKDGWFLPLTIRTLLQQKLGYLRSGNMSKQTPWSHIQTFAHEERLLLNIFSEFNLILSSVDVIGDYGPLRVKIYVLEK